MAKKVGNTVWIKDNGQEIELNSLPATEDKAESLGWKKKTEKKVKKETKDK